MVFEYIFLCRPRHNKTACLDCKGILFYSDSEHRHGDCVSRVAIVFPRKKKASRVKKRVLFVQLVFFNVFAPDLRQRFADDRALHQTE